MQKSKAESHVNARYLILVVLLVGYILPYFSSCSYFCTSTNYIFSPKTVSCGNLWNSKIRPVQKCQELHTNGDKSTESHVQMLNFARKINHSFCNLVKKKEQTHIWFLKLIYSFVTILCAIYFL